MSIFQAMALGLVQGLTEFLPVSSSAHLVLLPWFFGWRDPGLAFDVALHLGTLLALLIYFFRDWLDIFRTGLGGAGKSPQKTLWLLALGSLPGALAGVLFEKQAEGFFRSPLLVAVALAVAGVLLYLADLWGRRAKEATGFSVSSAIFIGLAQAAAIVPGVSRSGATITAARALGFNREAAARLSFLLATPITAGAAFYALRSLNSADITPAFFVGIVVAALAGLLAIRFLLRYVARASYRPFVWYRLVLAALVVIIIVSSK
ncbi:undecaprenyl-diphosphatase UppP [Patescibacteria group bacterium]|nr:MAG: undecaprenyl-diphosphatase UppP [Patescibacteria group bacterium]